MALAVRAKLAAANIALNSALHRWPWVSHATVYAFAMLLFSTYRVANVSAIAAALPKGDGADDSTGLRVGGVLFGLIQDVVVSSYLAIALYALDAALNRLSCCNDTAPNGCLDCFTHGLYFISRFKLLFKRLVRFAFAFAVYGAMVAAVAVDAVLVRSRHCRFSFDWLGDYLSDDQDRYPLVMERGEEKRLAWTAAHVSIALAVVFAVVNTVWVDLTRWCPFAQIDWRFVCRPCQRKRRQQTAESFNQPSINYIVIEHGEFFDSDDNQLRGTLSLMGQMAQADYASVDLGPRKEEESAWEVTVASAVICVLVLIVLPILLTVVARHLPSLLAQIALNVNVNEPVHGISGYNLYPSGGDSR